MYIANFEGRGNALNTLETEGQMVQRVMSELMGLKDILVLNDGQWSVSSMWKVWTASFIGFNLECCSLHVFTQAA